MTKGEVKTLLHEFSSAWKIDPHDAGLVYEQVPEEGIDAETLGDYLDGAGYPELATVVYRSSDDRPYCDGPADAEWHRKRREARA